MQRLMVQGKVERSPMQILRGIATNIGDYFTARSIRDKRKLTRLLGPEKADVIRGRLLEYEIHSSARAAGIAINTTTAMYTTIFLSGNLSLDSLAIGLIGAAGVVNAIDAFFSTSNTLEDLTEAFYRTSRDSTAENDTGHFYTEEGPSGEEVPFDEDVPGIGSNRISVVEAREILGIDSGATGNEIKKAYRKRALESHPDPKNNTGSGEKFQDVNEAYGVMKEYLNNPHQI